MPCIAIYNLELSLLFAEKPGRISSFARWDAMTSWAEGGSALALIIIMRTDH